MIVDEPDRPAPARAEEVTESDPMPCPEDHTLEDVVPNRADRRGSPQRRYAIGGRRNGVVYRRGSGR